MSGQLIAMLVTLGAIAAFSLYVAYVAKHKK